MRAAWQNSLPAADRLARYARALPALPAQPVISEHTETVSDLFRDEARGASHMKQRIKSATNPVNTIDASSNTNRSGIPANRRRSATPLRTLMAVAAAVVVVGLLGATFAIFARRLPSTAGAKSTATSAAHPTSTATNATGWTAVDRLTVTTSLQSAAPAIAPSDPRIVYEVISGQQPKLRRTTDEGQTWQSFPLPVNNASALMQVYVSPLDPNVLVLHTDGTASQSQLCLTQADSWNISQNQTQSHPIQPLADLAPNAPKSGGPAPCTQFLSTNGGRSWTQTPSEFFDNIGVFSPLNPGLFMVQDNRLYTYAIHSCQQPSSAVCSTTISLLVSVDGGRNWNPAPTPPSREAFCGVGMAPTGAVMFAVMAPTIGYCQGGNPSVAINTIWRSDDAGAHWAQVSQLQFSSVNSLVVVPNGDAAFPTAYLATNTMGTPTVTANGGTVPSKITFLMSQDGGKTWTHVPTSGIPAGWSGDGVIAQTNDGEVIAQFGPTGTVGTPLYSWKPGESRWHEIAPAPTSSNILYYLATSSQQGNGNTLWAVAVSSNGSATTYTVFRLQF
jgi:photosystem II stability/assembly factor-like uncharacterized protein